MTDYIVQTTDGRNISYTDDEIDSVWRRAMYAGLRVIRVITLDQYQLELYGPTYQAEVIAIHEQLKLNAELHTAAEELSA